MAEIKRLFFELPVPKPKVVGIMDVSAFQKPGPRLFLSRHAGDNGENNGHIYLGCKDLPLSGDGGLQARNSALIHFRAKFLIAYTSDLGRAEETARIILANTGNSAAPAISSAALRPREAGVLQGLDRNFAHVIFGKGSVDKWRKTFTGRPYEGGESLSEIYEKVTGYFNNVILAELKKAPKRGGNVLLLAHRDTVIVLRMLLEKISPEEAPLLPIPYCEPFIYELQPNGELAMPRSRK